MIPTPGSSTPKLGSASKEHSEDEWAAVQPYIVALYITHDTKLEDVVAAMEEIHGFRATAAMYKKRFRKWGVFKNKTKRSRELEALADAPPEPKKRPRADDEISRDVNNKRLSTVLLNDHLPPPVKAAPTDPYQHPALILAAIREWIEVNISTKRWHTDLSRKILVGPRPPSPPRHDFVELHVVFKFAFALRNRGEPLLAGKALRKAFVLLEDAVLDESPEMILHMFEMMVDLVLRKQSSVLGEFLSQFSGLAGCRLPGRHPLVQISTSLGHIHEGMQFWLLRSLRCAMDTFMAQLGNDYTILPRLHWLKGVVEPIGNSFVKKDPARVALCAESYGCAKPSMASSLGVLDMLSAKLGAEMEKTSKNSSFFLFQGWMTTVATVATRDGRWSIASEIWRDAADLESRYPLSHPVSIIEKLWLASDASMKAGDGTHTRLNEVALQQTLAYLGDIPTHEA